MDGIPIRGQLYRWDDDQLGRLAGYPTVFSVGNVVTGRGNILASRRHSATVSAHVIERFLGLANGTHAGENALLLPARGAVDDAVARIAEALTAGRPLEPMAVDALLARVRARQAAVGYTGSYAGWIEHVTPGDLA